ncbi:MAG: hydrogenase nickel incorporation protein HypB, partial [Pseudonocardiales bacterium]|nr:hydrogenase nickel incorporation protein HypB [Pseudonocardiales bacterium]
EDKPLKYPVMFRSADLVLVNKVDLLPHLDVDLGLFERNLAAVNPAVPRIDMSARTGEGVAEWCDWLLDRVRAPSRADPESAYRAPTGAG